jgi:hypothetical protein
MNKKSKSNSIKSRIQNAFPFLSTSIKERKKASGTKAFNGNYKIEEKGRYWKISSLKKSRAF